MNFFECTCITRISAENFKAFFTSPDITNQTLSRVSIPHKEKTGYCKS